MVLSALTGMKRVNLLMEDHTTELDQKSVNLILFQLYQKKFLYWKKEGTYTIRPEIRFLFEKMRDARKELQIYIQGKNSPLLCYYGKEVVITEVSENDRAAIKVHALSENEFMNELKERGIVPSRKQIAYGKELCEEKNRLLDEMKKNCGSFLEKVFSQQNKLCETINQEEWIKSIFLFYDRSDEAEWKAVFILDSGLWDYLVYVEKDKMLADYFSTDGLKVIFNK